MATGSRFDWRRPLGEFFIILVGVLAALWVENWRENAAERRIESEYLSRLVEDVAFDSVGIHRYLIPHVRRTHQAAELLQELVDNSSLSPTDPTAFVSALEEARSIQNNPWATATYAELLATGHMQSIRNSDLKSLAGPYYLSLEELYTWVERRVDRSFRDQAVTLLPADLRHGIYRRHWDEPDAPPDAWLDSAAATVDIDTSLRELRAIPDVSRMLGRVVDLTDGHLVRLGITAQRNAALLSSLRAELGG
jgi:hypothetical protein